MDPYIERPAIWPDFHDRLITYICAALQPVLRPRYLALAQDRLYVVESERPIRPDVAILRTTPPASAPGAGIAVLEPDSPAVFELAREEIREPFIQIVEPAAGNRVVTAIEVLSPDNKTPGNGCDSYRKKREEFWGNGTNLVEIDLLREGQPSVRLSAEKLAGLSPHHYLVAVTRRWPARQEIYSVQLEHRLPRVAIPLAADDKDVTLDMQAVFTRCWEEGPYPELLKYDGSPPGRLTREEVIWCEQRLADAGLRPESIKGSN